jgi:hypothetical protein
MKWRCHSGNKLTINDATNAALKWKTAHQRLLINPAHTAPPWQIAATRVSFR